MMANYLLGLILIFGIISGIVILILTCSRLQLKIYESNNYYKHRLILVVLDGFRHDYFEVADSQKVDITSLKSMAERGSRVMKMTPAFPSSTLPNHQTLLTGLFSPYHGITFNTFNDTSLNDKFAMENQQSLNDEKWYRNYPDPIWVTCEKHLYCKSGSMLFPNTDAWISGRRPFKRVDQYFPLNEPQFMYPYDRRIDEMLLWIKNDLIDFGMIYFDEPDATSHAYGPVNTTTLQVLSKMDKFIGRLHNGLKIANLSDRVDVIVIGDHGMTPLDQSRVIEIDNFVDPSLYKATYNYPVGIIYPNKGEEERVYNLYKNASTNIEVYWRKDVPDKYHYKDNPDRISPIVTIVKMGWMVNSSTLIVKLKQGHHGYSQYEDDMKASFVACGPSFLNKVISDANHVDLYSLMMHLLGLQANPNNGTFQNLSPLLTASAQRFVPRDDRWSYDAFVVIVIVILLVQIVVCLMYLMFLFYCYIKGKDIINSKIA